MEVDETNRKRKRSNLEDDFESPSKTKRIELDHEDEPSPYEKMRMKKIQENLSMLQSLGLSTGIIENLNKMNEKLPHPLKKKVKRRVMTKPLERKYALRSKGKENLFVPSTESDSNIEQIERKVEKDVEKEYNITNSKAAKYFSTEKEAKHGDEKEKKENDEQNENEKELLISGFTTDTTLYEDTQLKKIYAMHFCPSAHLLVCGGEKGRMAVFGMDRDSSDEESQEDESIAPILSYKAHDGWVSGVQFFSQVPNIVISCSNDKTIALWDINKQQEETKKAHQIINVSQIHGSGIFSMHEKDSLLLTSSKDATIALSQVTPTSIDRLNVFDSIHTSVVKSVKFQESNNFIFASGGNDRSVNVIDRRIDNPVVVSFEELSPYAINSVSWNPLNENMLMSAGFECKIFLHDIRYPKTLQNTIEGSNSKSSMIYHPLFCGNGSRIATYGEKNSFLSLFDTQTGKLISRGKMNFRPFSMIDRDISTQELALAHSKGISIYHPI